MSRWVTRAGTPIRERVLGPEHPDTLTTRDKLAHWSEEAAEALKLNWLSRPNANTS